MGDYILVAESQEEQPMELPLEEDGTLLLTTVEAQFPGASGIKFINPQSGAARGVRLAEGKFHSPDKNGWGDQVFFCVFPKGTIIEPRVDNKRKTQVDTQDEAEQPPAKATKLIPKCTDLIVLGLPWETDEASLKKYFEDNFGLTVMVQVKTNRSGKSRGFGFVRFSDYEIQKNVLKSRHMIDGRWCDVSLPPNAKSGSPKVFVGRLTSAISVKDLNEYFSTLGDVTDCFIPKPFRGFGFVTFLDPEVAKLACKIKDHDIGDVKVHVETAAPKPSQQSGVQERGFKGGRGARNVDYDETWDYGGGREERYGGRSAWSQGGSGSSGSGYGRDVGFNEHRGGIDLRGVSPSRLLSAIKDAGLADAIGGVIRGSGNRGVNSDNGYGRSYSSRSPPPAPPAPSWSRFDR